jgi:subtilisin family serine protease
VRRVVPYLLAAVLGVHQPSDAAELDDRVADDAREKLLNFESPSRIEGKYIVQFKSDPELAQIPEAATRGLTTAPGVLPTSRATAEELGTALSKAFGGELAKAYSSKKRRGFAITGVTEEHIEALASDPRVAFIEPAMRTELLTIKGNPPSSPAEWHLDRLDQLSLPLNGTYEYFENGAGVTVFVLDTGIRFTHNTFGGRAGTAAFDCVAFSNSNCPGVPSVVIHDESPDCIGHGTLVASIVGGTWPGVANGVTLIGIIVKSSRNNNHSCGASGDTSDIVQGLAFALEQADFISGRKVAVMSVIVPGGSTLVDGAVADLIDEGVVFVTGANNDNANACNYSPGRLPAVLTVGASNEADARADFSGYGSCVDLFAPGTNVKGAGIANDFANATSNGTSYSAPIVAGLAAMYLNRFPTATPAQVHTAIVNGAAVGTLTNVGAGSPNRVAQTTYSTGAPSIPIQVFLPLIHHLLDN